MTFNPETRASLLLRIRDPRDEQAWATFLEVYQPVIRRLARRRGLQDAVFEMRQAQRRDEVAALKKRLTEIELLRGPKCGR